MNLILIDKLSIVSSLVQEISSAEYLELDTETTGLDPYLSELISLQIGIRDNVYIIDVRKYFDWAKYLVQIISDSHKLCLFHNAKFDLKMIKHHLGELITDVYDTMLGEVLINQGVGKQFYSLKTVVEKYCGIVLEKGERDSFIDFKGELTQEMLIYAAMDVIHLPKIREEQLKILTEQKQLSVIDLENKLVPVVAQMELNGVLLDVDYWLSLAREEERKAEELKVQLVDTLLDKIEYDRYSNALFLVNDLGIPVHTKKLSKLLEELTNPVYVQTWVRENFNFNSPKQMVSILNMIGIPVKDTNEKTLTDYKDNDIIKLIIEYREHRKSATSFGENFIKFINPVTGRIHSPFHQLGTSTGRFSSGGDSGPNLQNIKRSQEYRKAFISPPGHKLLSCDYCLPGNTRVLKSDLTWVELKDLKVGDNLVSIDEQGGVKCAPRKMREATVEAIGNTNLPSYRITLENGKQLISSGEHPWLGVSNGTYSYNWIEARKLKPGNYLSFFVEPWDIENYNKYEIGYLAGVYDGEGSMHPGKRGSAISFYQMAGDVLDLVEKTLNNCGFEYTGPYEHRSGFNPDRTAQCIYLCGIDKIMNFLGLVRPIRLLKRQKEMWIGHSPFKSGKLHKIISVEFIGNKDLISMQTSTHTFLAEGYWTHNSQQEYRLAGAISREPKIIAAYQEGSDMHYATASIVYNKPVEEIKKEERQKSKQINFSIIYGAQSYALSKTLGEEEDVAKRILKQFYDGYPVLSEFKKLVEKKIVENCFSTTLLGRKRFFEKKSFFSDYKERDKYFRSLAKEGFNHIIQGTAADITKMALVNIHYNNPFGEGLKITMQVHDEIICEIADDILSEAVEFIVKCMEDAEQPFLGPIPAKAEAPKLEDITNYWVH